MAVAYDNATESHTGTTGSTSQASFTWTHAPAGTPAGVLVLLFTVTGTTTAPTAVASSVTYGSATLTQVPGSIAQDTATECGNAEAWFAGTSIPTGSQTVTVNRTNNTDIMYAVSYTVTASGSTEVYTPGIVLLQENGTYAEQSVDDGSPGTNSLRFAAGYSGGASVMSAGASSTVGPSIDFGAFTATVCRETTAGQGARNVGFSFGTSDDRAGVHLAVREIPPVSPVLELSGFGADTLAHSYDTINSVKVSYTHHETAGTLAPTFQLWDGTSAQIGVTFTCTTSTTDVTDTATFTGVTYAQLATLRVRVAASGSTGHIESADAVGIVVNYTAGTPPPATATLPPQQAPKWHPAAGPSAPGGTPFEAWPAWQGAALQSVTVTGAATAAGAGSVTADSRVTGLASQAVSLTGPDLLPGLPGGVAFEAWPVWEGATLPPGPVTVTGAATAAGAGSVTALATVIAPATAPGAGSVTDVVTEIPVASAAGAGAVTAKATQIAAATAAGAGSVTDVVTQIAGASAAGAGSVTAVGASSGAATATAAGAAAVTAVVTQIAPAAAAGAGAVTTAVTQAATASAAGAGSAGPAPVTQIAPATATGAGAVSDVVTQVVTASAAGAGSVTAAGSVIGSGNTATAAGAGAVTALAAQAAAATAAGAGSVTDVVTQIAKAAGAGAGTVTAAGQITGTANVTAAGSVTAKVAQAAIVTAAGAGALSALATQAATAALTGAASVTAAGAIQLAFTVGSLTASDAPAGVLTASAAPGGSGGVLAASDTRTGGPG